MSSGVPPLPSFPGGFTPAPPRPGTGTAGGYGGVTKCKMEFGGVNVMDPPVMLGEMYPGARFNYIDIPWCMSLPSRGCVLVSSAQLKYLEQNFVNVNLSLSLSLKLSVFREDNTVPPETPVIELKGLYLDRAVPLYGSHKAEYTSDPALSGFAETPDTFDGIWAVHFTDDRAWRKLYSIDREFNIAEPSGFRYWTATTQFQNPDDPEDDTWTPIPWTYETLFNELEDAVWPQDSDVTGRVEAGGFGDITANLIPRNLSFRGIPAALAMDMVLHSIGYVVMPDLRKEIDELSRYSVRQWGTVQTTGDMRIKMLHDFIGKIKGYRLWGGTQRRYTRVNIPDKLRVSLLAVRRDGYTSVMDPANEDGTPNPTSITDVQINHPTLIGVTVPGTEQYINTSFNNIEGDADDAESMKAKLLMMIHSQKYSQVPGHHVFHGWWEGFFDLEGWSVLSFQYVNGTPRTSIEIGGVGAPMGMIQKSWADAKLKGDPVPVGIVTDGGLSWIMSSEGVTTIQQRPLFFIGRIVARDLSSDSKGGEQRGLIEPLSPTEAEADWYRTDTNPLPTVTTTGEQVIAYLGHNTWLEVGDIVMCFYTGLKDPRWMAIGMPPVRGQFCEPVDCACDEVASSCAPCSAASVQLDDQVDLPTDDDLQGG